MNSNTRNRINAWFLKAVELIVTLSSLAEPLDNNSTLFDAESKIKAIIWQLENHIPADSETNILVKSAIKEGKQLRDGLRSQKYGHKNEDVKSQSPNRNPVVKHEGGKKRIGY